MKWILGALVILGACGSPKYLDDQTYVEQLVVEKPYWLFANTQCPADITSADMIEYDLGMDACEGAIHQCAEDCREGDAQSCHGAAYAAQMIEDEIYPFLFARACNLGIASGCTNAAAYRFNQASRRADDCVVRSFSKACEKGDSWGCAMESSLYATANGVDRDLKKANLLAGSFL